MTVEAPYLRIAAEIRDRIGRGELAPGEPVPSTRQIAREWGVAIATATKVLALLRQEGLVRAVPGVGTIVQQPAGRAPARGPSAGNGRAPASGRASSNGRASAGIRAPVSAPTPVSDRAPAALRGPGAERGDELSAERIVRAAIALADAEGLSTVSMRRVAASLDVSTMSLYRHVPQKEDLVLLMADATFGDHPPPARRTGDWRAQLEQLARLQWAGYRRHPWVPQVLSFTRPQVLPHGMAHTEWALSAFDGLGLDPSTMLHAAITLIGYVRGIALNLESQARDEQDTGLTDEQWMEQQEGAIARASAGRYPRLTALAATPIDMDLESLFEFGLRRLLDGYATMINRVRGNHTR